MQSNSENKKNKFVPLPTSLTTSQLSTYNHVDAILYWSMEKCLSALQDSVSKHKAMERSCIAKPAAVRKAVAERLQYLIQESNDSMHLQQLHTDLINAQSYLIDQMIIMLIQTDPDQFAHLSQLGLPPAAQSHSHDKLAQLQRHLRHVNDCLKSMSPLQPSVLQHLGASFQSDQDLDEPQEAVLSDKSAKSAPD